MRHVLPLAACLAGLLSCGGAPDPPTDAERAAPGPVFLLGFDGLDPRLVERWEGEGLLPNFSRLRLEGAVGDVRSTLPAISPPAWTTVSTGSPPSDHGIWSFWIPDGAGGGRYVDATARLARPIWSDLTALGRSVGVVNVPVTCPPDSVNGFMIAGFPYPSGAPLTWPPELESQIERRGYRRDVLGSRPEPGREEEWLDEIVAIREARRAIGLGLLFERRPDFSFIVFTTPDRIQHYYWRFHDPDHPRYDASAPERLRNAVRDAYVWCDDVLGEVVEKLPEDTTLLVLADHGFGPAYRGLSTATLLERLPPEQRALAATSPSPFVGDFFLDGTLVERRAFASGLEQVVDDAGEPVVGRTWDTRAERTRGYAAELGPAVVAEPREGLMFVPGRPGDPLIGELGPAAFSGFHRRRGYFAARGRPVVPGPVRDLDLRDVPAMAMHLLGEPIPKRYMHNMPRRMFPVAYFVERPMRFSGLHSDGLRRPDETMPAAADDAVADQLRSLGYVQ